MAFGCHFHSLRARLMMSYSSPGCPEWNFDVRVLEHLAAELQAVAASESLRDVASERAGQVAKRTEVVASLLRVADKMQAWSAVYHSDRPFEVEVSRAVKKCASQMECEGGEPAMYCVSTPMIKVFSPEPLWQTRVGAVIGQVAMGWLAVASVGILNALLILRPGAQDVSVTVNGEVITTYRFPRALFAALWTLTVFSLFFCAHVVNGDLFRDAICSVQCLVVASASVVAHLALMYNRYETLGRSYDLEWLVCDAIFGIVVVTPFGCFFGTLDSWRFSTRQKLCVIGSSIAFFLFLVWDARFQTTEWSNESNCIGSTCGPSAKMVYCTAHVQVAAFLAQAFYNYACGDPFGCLRPLYSATVPIADAACVMGYTRPTYSAALAVADTTCSACNSSSGSEISAAEEASLPVVAMESLADRPPVTHIAGAGFPVAPLPTTDNSIPEDLLLQTPIL